MLIMTILIMLKVLDENFTNLNILRGILMEQLETLYDKIYNKNQEVF